MDNVLWDGRVLDESDQSTGTKVVTEMIRLLLFVWCKVGLSIAVIPVLK